MSAEIVRLRAINRVYEQLATQLDNRTLLTQFAQLLVDQFTLPRVVILTWDASHSALEYGTVAPRLTDAIAQTRLELILIPILSVNDSLIDPLKQGHMIEAADSLLSHSAFEPLRDVLPDQNWLLASLSYETRWQAVVAMAGAETLSGEDRQTLNAMMTAASALVHNANEYKQLRLESDNTLAEMQTFQQIDAELNDTIDLSYVFRMILDWALRFTGADAAILGLYDEMADVLEILVQYGYDSNEVTVGRLLKHDGGVSLRVAQQGKAAMIHDVATDKDYHPAATETHSLLSVPILREDRVVAVMTLESNKVSGFTDDHLAFARKLASRAGVSVHNARLFSETQRERHKLALILGNIADIVMVLDESQRVVLLNHSALQAFNLSEQQKYIGEKLDTLIPDSPLLMLLDPSITQSRKDSTIRLPNGRIYNVIVTAHPDIGRTVVLQDVTYFKEMDQLKSELVTTVTHDLKQPLSIMRGYLDLLNMSGNLDDRAKRYVGNLEHAFGMMRQLIDDLLDMARIESGVQLALLPLSLNEIVQICLTSYSNTLHQRNQTLELDLPDLPLVEGDGARLMQVFQNLVSNAIKYTPPNGHIRIWGVTTLDSVQIHIQDSGIGISPEDQSRIFERFFRVRNSQTAKIEGTGLGLAIVKSLVDAHGGTIGVTSERELGSTFTVSLPIYKVQPSRQLDAS